MLSKSAAVYGDVRVLRLRVSSEDNSFSLNHPLNTRFLRKLFDRSLGAMLSGVREVYLDLVSPVFQKDSSNSKVLWTFVWKVLLESPTAPTRVNVSSDDILDRYDTDTMVDVLGSMQGNEAVGTSLAFDARKIRQRFAQRFPTLLQLRVKYMTIPFLSSTITVTGFCWNGGSGIKQHVHKSCKPATLKFCGRYVKHRFLILIC